VLAAPPLAAQTLPDGFDHEMVVGGPFGGEPTGFGFLPDGRVLLVERNSGNVRLATVGSGTSTVIYTVPNVSSELERGLLGVVADPDWPTRPYVYVYFTEVGNLSVVQMLTATGDLTDPQSSSLALGSPFRLLEVTDDQPFHNGGTVVFGTDGMLLLGIGDDLTLCNSQDLTEPRGGLLRLDVSSMPGAGSGPPPLADLVPADNPFVANPDDAAKLVYAWGLRNPFRFDVDPATGDVWIGDVGRFLEEEVDVLPAVSGGGQNYGWPIREGFSDPELETCGENNPFVDPVYAYPHTGVPAAIIGGPLYRTVAGLEAFPASYDGSYFFYGWMEGWLRRLVPDGGGGYQVAAAVPGQPSADNWAEDLGDISQLLIGPDGALWIMIKNTDTMLRGIHRIYRTDPTGAPVSAAGGGLRVTAAPNPARAGDALRIRWASPRAGAASLRVYDVSGRLVRELEDAGRQAAGTFEWRGDDAGGRSVPAGVYFYRLEQGRAAAEGRLTLIH
jgi:glucose/arabinose dehydrogenase